MSLCIESYILKNDNRRILIKFISRENDFDAYIFN